MSKRFNLDQVPEPPVNVDDPGDEMYAPYIMADMRRIPASTHWRAGSWA